MERYSMEIIQTIGRLAATQGVWDLKVRPQLTEPAHRGKFFVSSLQATRVMGGVILHQHQASLLAELKEAQRVNSR